MRQFAEIAGIILPHQVRHRLANVPEEALGNFRAADNASGQGRQKGLQIVAAAGPKLLPETGRPVLRPSLPTVNMSSDQCFARQRFGIRDDLGHQAVEHRFCCFPAQFVCFQPQTGLRRGMIFHASGSMTKAENRPLADRGWPIQAPIGCKSRGQVDNFLDRNGLFRWNHRKFCSRRDKVRGKSGLGLNAFQTGIPRRGGKGQDGDVLVIMGGFLGFPQDRFKMARPFDVGLGPNDLLHRKFRRDPRTAAAAPASVIIHIDLQSQTMGFGADMLKQLAPDRRTERRLAFGRALVHFHDEHAADAGPLHRLEVGGDAVTGQIAIEPEPIHPRSRRSRWLQEALFQTAGSANGCGQGEEK